MTVKGEVTINRWKVWVAIAAVALTVIAQLVQAGINVAVDRSAVERQIVSAESRLTRVERDVADIKSMQQDMIEIKVNLKALAQHQGIPYQEGGR